MIKESIPVSVSKEESLLHHILTVCRELDRLDLDLRVPLTGHIVRRFLYICCSVRSFLHLKHATEAVRAALGSLLSFLGLDRWGWRGYYKLGLLDLHGIVG